MPPRRCGYKSATLEVIGERTRIPPVSVYDYIADRRQGEVELLQATCAISVRLSCAAASSATLPSGPAAAPSSWRMCKASGPGSESRPRPYCAPRHQRGPYCRTRPDTRSQLPSAVTSSRPFGEQRTARGLRPEMNNLIDSVGASEPYSPLTLRLTDAVPGAIPGHVRETQWCKRLVVCGVDQLLVQPGQGGGAAGADRVVRVALVDP